MRNFAGIAPLPLCGIELNAARRFPVRASDLNAVTTVRENIGTLETTVVFNTLRHTDTIDN